MRHPDRFWLLESLGLLCLLAAVVCLGMAGYEGTLKADDSPWFKPAKYLAAWGAISFMLGKASGYLPLKSQRISVGFYIMMLMLVQFGCWLATLYHHFSEPVGYPPAWANHGLMSIHALQNLTWLGLIMPVGYILHQLTRVDRRRLALPYLFGLRTGLFMFILALLLSTTLAQYGVPIETAYTFGHEGLPFFYWQINHFQLRAVFTICSLALIWLPGVGFMLSRGQQKGSVLYATVLMAIISLVLVLAFGITWVGIKTDRPFF